MTQIMRPLLLQRGGERRPGGRDVELAGAVRVVPHPGEESAGPACRWTRRTRSSGVADVLGVGRNVRRRRTGLVFTLVGRPRRTFAQWGETVWLVSQQWQ